MPLFDYRCDSCTHQFEVLVRNSNSSKEIRCEECGSEQVHRLLSLPAAPLQATTGGSSSPCGQGPPCGAPWCQRPG